MLRGSPVLWLCCSLIGLIYTSLSVGLPNRLTTSLQDHLRSGILFFCGILVSSDRQKTARDRDTTCSQTQTKNIVVKCCNPSAMRARSVCYCHKTVHVSYFGKQFAALCICPQHWCQIQNNFSNLII